MNRTFLLPSSPVLSKYVSSILAIENDTYINGFTLPLYANGAPTIVFQTAKASKQDRTVGHLTLYGQTIAPDALDFEGAFTMIAYFLHPHSLKSLFGIEAHELTDGCIDLNDQKQVKKMHLQEQLLNETSLNARLQRMDNFILKLSDMSSDRYRKILFATNALKRMNGSRTLADIQKELSTTERSLQRLFEKNVGISPRMYKRVCQFHAAFQQLNRGRFSKLIDIAYGNGFSDQSHFNRVFKEFTGITPTEYLGMGKELSNHFKHT